MAARQNTASPNDNYNVLKRENNTHNNLDPAKNPCNISEYDLLNHSKRASSVEDISGNYTTLPMQFSAKGITRIRTTQQVNQMFTAVLMQEILIAAQTKVRTITAWPLK